MNKPYLLLICLALSRIPVIAAPAGVEQIRSNLYVKQSTGSPVLLDGDLTQYDPSYSNSVDGKDARKMSNFSENIGMLRGSTVLVIERRQTISSADTIFFKLWQLHQLTYQLEFITNSLDHPGMTGFLEDSYLHTSSPVNLNGVTTSDFTVTADPASADAFRFRIIFNAAASGPLPVTFTSIKAVRKNNDIQIDWKTESEKQVAGYSLEKSVDGVRFNNLTTIRVAGLPGNIYSWLDSHAGNVVNYYRIQTSDKDGKVNYSEIVKVYGWNVGDRMKIYPNPARNSTVNFEIESQPAGNYEVRLFNNSGQVVVYKKLQHTGGNLTGKIESAQQVNKGIYQLEITTPGNQKIMQKIVY